MIRVPAEWEEEGPPPRMRRSGPVPRRALGREDSRPVRGLSLRCRRLPLSEATTLGIGGLATVYEPERVEDVGPAMLAGRRMGLWILGGGSNLLVSDRELPGLVLSASRMRGIERQGRELLVRAGTPLATVIQAAHRAGLSGLEPLVGIPAQFGGAVAMNCGGGGFSLADRLTRVRLVLPSGRVVWNPVCRERFGYRSNPWAGAFVAEARVRLDPERPEGIRARMARYAEQKQRCQPLHEPSAGCVFRNPPGGPAAGALLDRAGLKGMGIGKVFFSRRHANFLIARAGARMEDALRLIRHARERVLEAFGVLLATEVVAWDGSRGTGAGAAAF